MGERDNQGNISEGERVVGLQNPPVAPLPLAPSTLYRQTVAVLTAAGLLLLAINGFMTHMETLGLVTALTSLTIYGVVGTIVVSRILAFHPHADFGWPNTITLLRIVLAALIAGYTAEISLWRLPPSDGLATAFAALAGLAVLLDGVDGWLARRIGPRSAFGARFDMESDALLILILSVLAMALGKAGPWILAIGLMRYAFLGAAHVLPWMGDALPHSEVRRFVCVFQGAALTLLAAPFVAGEPATLLASTALCLLTLSFGRDLLWLYRKRPA